MAKTPLAPGAGRRVVSYIADHRGGTLTPKQIDKLCGTPSSNEQYMKIIGPLVKDGVLIPASKELAKGNQNKPIYKAYRICEQVPEHLPHSAALVSGDADAGSLSLRLSGLTQLLAGNPYLVAHPKHTAAWQHELALFSQWIDGPGRKAAPAFPEERAYEVFGDEKILLPGQKARGGATLLGMLTSANLVRELKLLGGNGSVLPSFVPSTIRCNLCLLIVENHVSYLRLADGLAHGRHTFFGRRIDGVVYGLGSAVTGAGALGSVERLLPSARAIRYLYWGDLDRTGIWIYDKLKTMGLGIEPLVPAYQEMLAGVKVQSLPASRCPNTTCSGADIASQLTPAELETYIQVLVLNKRIPQEAVDVVAHMGFGVRSATKRLTPRCQGQRSVVGALRNFGQTFGKELEFFSEGVIARTSVPKSRSQAVPLPETVKEC